MRLVAFIFLGWVSLLSSQALATPIEIGFEGFAPAGGLVNVAPDTAYSEDGFTITPTNGQSAIFDAAAAADFPGRSDSSFFGFAESNTLTLSFMGGGAFSLVSLIAGPSTIATSASIDLTVTATLSDSSMVVLTFTDLMTATLIELNIANVVSAMFSTTDDAALDNILVNFAEIPVPAAAPIFLMGIAALGFLRRRRASRVA